MPLVELQVIAGVFDAGQKRTMNERVTDAVVSVEGEAMSGVTWVRIREIASGEWAIGGQTLSTGDVKAMQAPAS